MLELGSSGSVRGVSSNGHPYRDPGSKPDTHNRFLLKPSDWSANAGRRYENLQLRTPPLRKARAITYRKRFKCQ